MKRVEIEVIEGIGTPKEQVKDLGFGTLCNGTEWLIFESQQEATDNLPIDEPSTVLGTAVQALLSATPEEIEQIKQILNK